MRAWQLATSAVVEDGRRDGAHGDEGKRESQIGTLKWLKMSRRELGMAFKVRLESSSRFPEWQARAIVRIQRACLSIVELSDLLSMSKLWSLYCLFAHTLREHSIYMPPSRTQI